ncbi:MAG: hypothetical protein ACO1TE_03080 [Prosthecobacter sp.]
MKRWFLMLLPLVLPACATKPKPDSGGSTKATHKPIDGYAEFNGLSQAAGIKKGRKLAKEHFKRGDYQMLTFGLPGPENAEEITYKERLKARYGVVVSRMAGCVLSNGIIGGAMDYNATMTELLKEKFGVDVFEEAKKEGP